MSALSSDIPIPPQKIQTFVLGIILILLLLAVCRLFAPFFTILLWSTMLYILLSPLHHRLIKKIDVTKPKGIILKNLWAGVFALGTGVLILLPLFFVTLQFFRQVISLTNWMRDVFYTKPGILQDIFGYLSNFIREITGGQISLSADDIQGRIMTLLSSGIQNLVQFSSILARDVGLFFFSLLLMVFSLFFFYMDGSHLSRLFLRVIPIRKQYLSALVGKFMDSTRNLFFGYIIVALIQSLLGYGIYCIFQIKGALVFAVLTFICVFIPIIGGGIIWLPLGILRILNGDILGGIIFLLISGLCISILDNFLRPIFLQNRIHLHPLIIFFAILGGLRTFGFNGLILGPILVILFLTVLDLFLTEHKIEAD